jgi:hypothetical protein
VSEPRPTTDGEAEGEGEVPAPPSPYPTSRDRYPSGDGQVTSGVTLDEGVRIPSRIATRLRVLDADFAAIASRSGGIVNGILSIVTGGLSVTLGFLVNDETLSPYLFVFGGSGVARGIIDLALTPNAHDPYIKFSHMPMGTMDEVRARLEYGENELSSIANRQQIARILDASINIGVGLAIVPLYLGPNGFDDIDAFGAFVIIGAGISVVSGVISLLTRSEAERRWSSYEELRDRLDEEEEARAEGVRIQVGGGPLPGGGGLSLVGTF